MANIRPLFAVIFVLTVSLVLTPGCGTKTAAPAPASTSGDHDHDDHNHGDHDDHDHDDHAGHDHAAHGPNGGHMVDLTGGAHAEWAHNDDQELLAVYPENADQVTGVEMKTTIQGETTVYPFEKADDDSMTVYSLTSPELLTAIKMGDAVETVLVITTKEGEATGKVVHHAH
ncbi:hypothetical protein Poly51_52570 [Rubripirellula tenax]|uniref:Uncharacterized protein n=1 Tax=Rubripirellula tenax TaxID=2528015 RepID=A0A5C6EHD7_9BACT|nr:hypothetical protein [Rubripirellula tenax]TWU47457.1 hypothetical protein Poly51_52570 [Rubripirellula tenax]